MIHNNDQIDFVSELAESPRCTYVLIFTEKNVFEGYTTHSVSERFLDILNHGSTENRPNLTRDVLALNEVEIIDPDGKRDNVPGACLLLKNNTLVVAEKPFSSCEPPPSRPFPFASFRLKKPVPVNIQIQDLNITGEVYISQSESSLMALEMDQLFIPVTNAVISHHFRGVQTEFDFIAVNKNRIVSISEISGG